MMTEHTSSLKDLKLLRWMATMTDGDSDYFFDTQENKESIIYRAGTIRAAESFAIMDVDQANDGLLNLMYSDAENSDLKSMTIIRSAYSAICRHVSSGEWTSADALLAINDSILSCWHNPYLRTIIGSLNVGKNHFRYSTAALGFYKYSTIRKGPVELILRDQQGFPLGVFPREFIKHPPKIFDEPIEPGDMLLFLPNSLIFMNRYFSLPPNILDGFLLQHAGCPTEMATAAILNGNTEVNLWPNDSTHPCPILSFPKEQVSPGSFFSYLFSLQLLNGMFLIDELLPLLKANLEEIKHISVSESYLAKELAVFKQFTTTTSELDHMTNCSRIMEHIEGTTKVGPQHFDVKLKDSYYSMAIHEYSVDTMGMMVFIK